MTAASVALDIRSAARDFGQELRRAARESEALGTMPPALAAAAKAAGMFTLALPKSLGGHELDPMSLVEIIEELAAADGSGGWSTLISNNTAFFAWLDPPVARQLLGSAGGFAATCMFTPQGRAIRQDDGTLSVSGRWPFSSGCRHADWLQTGMYVMDGARPRQLPDGRPDYRFAFIRRPEATIVGSWDALGLRGTGSLSVVVKDLPVAEEHTAALFSEPARHDGSLWRIPCFTLAGIFLAGFPLGVGRRALDEFVQIGQSRTRAPSRQTILEESDAQVTFARAEAKLLSARSFVFDTLGQLWRHAEAGDTPGLVDRRRAFLALQQAMLSAVEVVDSVFSLAGARSVGMDDPLLRCFRDIHTACQHAFFSSDALKRYARSVLDGVDTFMI